LDGAKLKRVGAIWPSESISGIFRVIGYKHRIVLSDFWRFFVVFPVEIYSLRAHSRTRNGNTVIKDANLKIQVCK
jgi:hypothetical protein